MDTPEKEHNPPDPMEYGRSIPSGLGINLLVSDVERAADFQCAVFGARIVYREKHFAILHAVGSTWLLHSDWSYRAHPMRGLVAETSVRGPGVELRLYGVDPDRAEEAARKLDAVILSPAADQAHGLREACIVDADGFVWVPSVALKTGSDARG